MSEPTNIEPLHTALELAQYPGLGARAHFIHKAAVATLAALEAERDEYGRALARIAELNPEFVVGGKGSWQLRAEAAENRVDYLANRLVEAEGLLARCQDGYGSDLDRAISEFRTARL